MAATQDGGQNSPLRAVVEVVVKTLVDHPEAVKVTESVRRGMTIVELSTSPGDMGKVMGVVKPKLAGRADMGKVSGLVKAKLTG